jgi:hypothetical protein
MPAWVDRYGHWRQARLAVLIRIIAPKFILTEWPAPGRETGDYFGSSASAVMSWCDFRQRDSSGAAFAAEGMLKNCVFGTYRAPATKISFLSVTSANPAIIRIDNPELRNLKTSAVHESTRNQPVTAEASPSSPQFSPNNLPEGFQQRCSSG